MGAFLEVRDLKHEFSTPWGQAKRGTQALSGITLSLGRGETLGCVGESGAGKSTLARCLLGLVTPSSGTIIFDGADITRLSRAERKPFRKRIQLIFQDPHSSLNPRLTVGALIHEPVGLYSKEVWQKRKDRVTELLAVVQLGDPILKRYPHELSGGQRQRVAIARALAVNPELLVCDEALSALDVSTQAEMLELLSHLQRQLHLSCLFISHDFRSVMKISHRIAVLKNGKIIEEQRTEDLLSRPKSRYTQTLLEASFLGSRC